MMAHAGGRPLEYTKEKADKICYMIADGKSLKSICREDDMPDIVTVYHWFRKVPEFLNQYTQAKDDQMDTLADEMLEIADDGTNDFVEKQLKNGTTVLVADHELVNRSRLRVDTRKWIAERLKPKKYGVKTETEVNLKTHYLHEEFKDAENGAISGSLQSFIAGEEARI